MDQKSTWRSTLPAQSSLTQSSLTQSSCDQSNLAQSSLAQVEPWAIALPAETNPVWLGDLRVASEQDASESLGGIRVLDLDDETIWLRGNGVTLELRTRLAAIPNATYYRILDDEQLAPMGRSVPSNRLPGGEWISLKDWLPVALPSCRFAGVMADPPPIRLVRSNQTQQVNLMLCDFHAWSNYALNAAKFRLNSLKFACSENEKVLVHGTPLPPIQGSLWFETHGIAVPCGFRWEPDVDAEVLRELLERSAPTTHGQALFVLDVQSASEEMVDSNKVALEEVDSDKVALEEVDSDKVALEVISDEAFTPATYASVRATARRLAEVGNE